MNNDLEIFKFDKINSTNNFLSKQQFKLKNQLCIADTQTNGKGQYDRIWENQIQNALFSIKTKISDKVCLNGLSLVVGIAIITVLQKHYNLNNLQLKWPNDILLNNKKLAGILIENQIQNNFQYPVIGVGINILSNDFANIGHIIDKQQLILKISKQILHYIKRFKVSGFKSFIQQWQKLDYLTNNKIAIKHNDSIGVSIGVDDSGFLIFQNGNDSTIIYNSKQIII